MKKLLMLILLFITVNIVWSQTSHSTYSPVHLELSTLENSSNEDIIEAVCSKLKDYHRAGEGFLSEHSIDNWSMGPIEILGVNYVMGVPCSDYKIDSIKPIYLFSDVLGRDSCFRASSDMSLFLQPPVEAFSNDSGRKLIWSFSNKNKRCVGSIMSEEDKMIIFVLPFDASKTFMGLYELSDSCKNSEDPRITKIGRDSYEQLEEIATSLLNH